MHWARHLVDILKAVNLIARPEGATVYQLAEHIGKGTRTVYRMLRTMEDLNFPLYEDNCGCDDRKRWRFEDSYLRKFPNLAVPEPGLTLAELIALSFVRGGVRTFRGTEIEKDLESAFVKLDALLPEQLSKQLDKVHALFVPAGRFTKDYRDKEEVIESLTDAIFRRRTCLVEYHSFRDDTVKGFKIDPLSFFERDGGLYLFVRTTSFGDIRILAVERIRRLTVTDDAFEPPADFDPEGMLDSAFNLICDDPVTAKVRVSRDQARYVRERRWAAKQEIEEQADGSVLITFETSGRWDVKRWVLAFGAEAELLEPKDLRREIADELRRAAGAYGAARTKRGGTGPGGRGSAPGARKPKG